MRCTLEFRGGAAQSREARNPKWNRVFLLHGVLPILAHIYRFHKPCQVMNLARAKRLALLSRTF